MAARPPVAYVRVGHPMRHGVAYSLADGRARRPTLSNASQDTHSDPHPKGLRGPELL